MPVDTDSVKEFAFRITPRLRFRTSPPTLSNLRATFGTRWLDHLVHSPGVRQGIH
jgi:hypothetical protein